MFSLGSGTPALRLCVDNERRLSTMMGDWDQFLQLHCLPVTTCRAEKQAKPHKEFSDTLAE